MNFMNLAFARGAEKAEVVPEPKYTRRGCSSGVSRYPSCVQVRRDTALRLLLLQIGSRVPQEAPVLGIHIHQKNAQVS
jgi:hypothetical protein